MFKIFSKFILFFFILADTFNAKLYNTNTVSIPFTTCDGITDNMGITDISLIPTHPESDKTLLIYFTGTADMFIQRYSKIMIQIEIGSIIVQSSIYDLCVGSVMCPIYSGTEINSYIPFFINPDIQTNVPSTFKILFTDITLEQIYSCNYFVDTISNTMLTHK